MNWSVGAFDTMIEFADGSSAKCKRRERPQMITDGSGRPVAMASGVTGCPQRLGVGEDSEGAGSRGRAAPPLDFGAPYSRVHN